MIDRIKYTISYYILHTVDRIRRILSTVPIAITLLNSNTEGHKDSSSEQKFMF